MLSRNISQLFQKEKTENEKKSTNYNYNFISFINFFKK